MKLLLQKCGICSHWHNPCAHNGHCPNCSAVKLMSGVYINSATNRVMVTGIKPYQVNAVRQLRIARILSDDI
jgi:hypothetical protein